jgi:hypothetical protein
MATFVGGCQLIIDPEVAADPTLGQAIRDGMEYLALTPGFCSDTLTARWQYDGAARDHLRFEVRETDDGTEVRASRQIPVAHMRNPVYRDLWASRVWGDFLSQRIGRTQDRIRQLMARLLEDESGAQPTTDASDDRVDAAVGAATP